MNNKFFAMVGIAILLSVAILYFDDCKTSKDNLGGSPSAAVAESPSPDLVSDKPDESAPKVSNEENNSQDIASPVDNYDEKLLTYEKRLAAVLREESKGRKDIVWRKFIKGTGPNAELHNKLFREYIGFLQLPLNQTIVAPGLRIIDMFFDIDTFELSEKERELLPKNDEMREHAFGYIADLDPIWCLEYASDICNDTKAYTGGRDNLPERYRAYWDEIEKGNNEVATAVTALSHIFLHSYDYERGKKLTHQVLRAIKDSGIDVKGKIIADIGSGSGMALPFFREATGAGVKLFAVDVDPYTLDLLRYTSQFADAIVVDGTYSDCCLPAESVDIIVLLGVHMGSGFHEHYETKTLPWMKSMQRALRPGGIIVIHEGNIELLDEGLVSRMESAGFKLRKMFSSNRNDENNYDDIHDEFIAVFDKN